MYTKGLKCAYDMRCVLDIPLDTIMNIKSMNFVYLLRFYLVLIFDYY